MNVKVSILAKPREFCIPLWKQLTSALDGLEGVAGAFDSTIKTGYGVRIQRYRIKPRDFFTPDNWSRGWQEMFKGSSILFKGKALCFAGLDWETWGLGVPVAERLDRVEMWEEENGYFARAFDFIENWVDAAEGRELITFQSEQPVRVEFWSKRDPYKSPPAYLFSNHIFEYRSKRVGEIREEITLDLLEVLDLERKKYERLKTKFTTLREENIRRREPIPEEVRIAVWHRDGGKCVRCGSKEKLEYDHIVPVSKGGSNTVRNIELLCESCNRSKSDNIQ